ncbi:MAG: helix-turn-helix domain-containing protein [Drouetiella hepatica Uher 2000/2452]|jgi:transcriptional regulator with XRE-family HTH domain|uniref:Helix-turn-helix domain-containing protein n=1 Tax=Drouetiella hepatica Uher 2000/2452 TaxID=904376 RepID=A0A951QFJ8_9CYAN|nr:helix-turn-helix domain-containing protein [Drouetiella hepatica Uher 2000/2452]
MDHRESLNFVISTFKLKAVDLAQRSGVDPYQLSRFRNGRIDFLSHTLFKVVDALSYEQRAVFYGLMQGSDCKETQHEINEGEKYECHGSIPPG